MNHPLQPSAIDAARVRRLFARRTEEAFIVREVAARLAERLDLMKIAPAVVLDVGAGLGIDVRQLALRYPGALVAGLDLARDAPKPESAGLRRLFRRPQALPWMRADLRQLPLAPASVDLLWSNCALHWSADPAAAIAAWSSALRPGGLVLFSCFGPNSLAEVRAAFAAADEAHHTFAFVDMHDYGDMMTSAGLLDPVVDMETITLTFADAKAFWRDVRALGGNALSARRRGLMGRQAATRLRDALEAQREDGGPLTLTFEIVYGHAWRGRPRKGRDGEAVVALPQSRRERL